MNTILALKLVFLNACLALGVRERTRAAPRGNNRSDFPKGSDTGTKINCTVLKMNKGICAVIKEAWVLPPCRPEPTFNKPTAVPDRPPARLMDFASTAPQSLTGNRVPHTHTHTHTVPVRLLQRKLSHMHICRQKPNAPPPLLNHTQPSVGMPMYIYIDYSERETQMQTCRLSNNGSYNRTYEKKVRVKWRSLSGWGCQWHLLIRECWWNPPARSDGLSRRMEPSRDFNRHLGWQQGRQSFYSVWE